jgi:phospholipase/carboxylesterase
VSAWLSAVGCNCLSPTLITIMTSTTTRLETVEQEPDRPAEASVIWMHGLGADGHDFASLPSQLGVAQNLAIRYVFPHAPIIPVTLNMGMRMRAWYDIVSLDARGQDETGIRRSATSIADLIACEVERGVPSSRIVLAGFSQGAAMALYTGLRHAAPLAGILALSGYLPLHEALPVEASEANQQVEILYAHGQHDNVVPYDLGHGSAELLRAAGYAVEWHEYAMAHEVCPEEVREIGRWLTRVLDQGAGGRR